MFYARLEREDETFFITIPEEEVERLHLVEGQPVVLKIQVTESDQHS